MPPTEMPPKKKKAAGTATKKKKASKTTLPPPPEPSPTRRSLPPPPAAQPAISLLTLKLKLLHSAPHVPSSFDLILPVTATLATLVSHLQTRHGLMKDLVVYTSQHPPTTLSLLDPAHTTLGKCLGLTAEASSSATASAAAAAAAAGGIAPFPVPASRRVSVAMPGKKEEMVMPIVFLYYDFKPAVDGPLLRYEPPWC
jgi:hypothetical protein